MNELDAFLDSIEKNLDFLDPALAADIKEEMRSHILDSAEASGRSILEIVQAMGRPEDIARRYREEFRDGGGQRKRGIHIDFMPDEEERKGKRGCPGGNGPWPDGCFDPPHGQGGCWGRGEGPHRPKGPWEEMGKAFGPLGREFGHLGREFGRMGREWARTAEGFEPRFHGFEKRMRHFFKDVFFFDESESESREIILDYPKAAACRFDFPAANIFLKKGSGDRIILRARLRGRPEAAAPWKPEETRSGDSSLSLAESGFFPPFATASAKRLEIEIPDGVESVELRSLSGSIKAEGVAAGIRATSASGDIALTGVGAGVFCKTASGDLRIEGISGSVEASAVSGDIRFKSVNSGSGIEYSSVSGAVSVNGEARQRKGNLPGGAAGAKLSTVSGDIDIVTA